LESIDATQRLEASQRSLGSLKRGNAAVDFAHQHRASGSWPLILFLARLGDLDSLEKNLRPDTVFQGSTEEPILSRAYRRLACELGDRLSSRGLHCLAELSKRIASPTTHRVVLSQICLSILTVFLVWFETTVLQPAHVTDAANLSVKAIVPILVAVDRVGRLGEGVIFHRLANLAGG
jgi:hypothetical protein